MLPLRSRALHDLHGNIWGLSKEVNNYCLFVEHVKNTKKYDEQTTNISVMYLNTCSGLVYGTINDFH